MIVVQARVHAIAEGRDTVARAIQDLARGTRGRAGCLEYLAGELLGEPGEFVIVTRWDDETSMRAHYDDAAYGRYATEVTPLLARETETIVQNVAESSRPVGDPSFEPLRAD